MNAPLSINATGMGTYVVDIHGDVKAGLNITGLSSDNVDHQYQLANWRLNSDTFALFGGLTNSDVVYNFAGYGGDLQTSGGLNNESVINGIITGAFAKNRVFPPA